jgi:anti-anti-sigma regulatory factor
VQVVRPALSAAPLDAGTIEAQLLSSLGRAILADFVGALPRTVGGGAGRAALLSCGESTLQQLDGLVVCDFLEADGWAVQRLHGPRAALELGPASRAAGVELAVAVVGGPEEALRLAPACTEMQRLPDPPVCLLCDFTGRSDWPTASTALGADAFISDPRAVPPRGAGGRPAGITRRWGVSIARRSDALVLSPTGRLDATSAGRLAEVVESRLGSFARLVIDLRDLAEISTGGVEDICAWQGNAPLADVELLLVGDAGVRSRIDALGMDRPVLLADAATI